MSNSHWTTWRCTQGDKVESVLASWQLHGFHSSCHSFIANARDGNVYTSKYIFYWFSLSDSTSLFHSSCHSFIANAEALVGDDTPRQANAGWSRQQAAAQPGGLRWRQPAVRSGGQESHGSKCTATTASEHWGSLTFSFFLFEGVREPHNQWHGG